MGKYRKYYDRLSLCQLRRRQHINKLQTQEAYRLLQTLGRRQRGLKALIRLQRIALLLADSVDRIYGGIKCEN